MAKPTTTAPTAESLKTTVEPIDFTKGISIILYQTGARNNTNIFTGRGHAKRAEDQASDLALNGGKTVAVFHQQSVVKVPPKEPQADDLPLDFDDDAFEVSEDDAPEQDDTPSEAATDRVLKKEGDDLVDQGTGEVVNPPIEDDAGEDDTDDAEIK